MEFSESTGKLNNTIQWLGVLDLRKMWVVGKSSCSRSSEVRVQCIRAILNQCSPRTIDEISEVICNWLYLPNCDEIFAVIYNELTTSRRFRQFVQGLWFYLSCTLLRYTVLEM